MGGGAQASFCRIVTEASRSSKHCAGRWPEDLQLSVQEDYLDTLATEPVDTLLCPKFSKVTVQ